MQYQRGAPQASTCLPENASLERHFWWTEHISEHKIFYIPSEETRAWGAQAIHICRREGKISDAPTTQNRHDFPRSCGDKFL